MGKHSQRWVGGLGSSVLLFSALVSHGSADARLVANLEAGKPQAVVTYGTSLTEGGAWVAQLSAELSRRYPGLATVINSGASGMWSTWGVENLEARVLAKQPDAVFIEFSINDAFLEYRTSVEQARANLGTMIDRILAAKPSCEIILMVMNPPTGVHLERRPQIESYNQMYHEVAAQRHLMLIDHYPAWQQILQADRDRFFAYVPDGIHPNAEGCRKVILPSILKALGLSVEDKAGGDAGQPSAAP